MLSLQALVSKIESDDYLMRELSSTHKRLK